MIAKLSMTFKFIHASQCVIAETLTKIVHFLFVYKCFFYFCEQLSINTMSETVENIFFSFATNITI